MRDKYIFSIVIPTYNGEKTIGNLLNKIHLLIKNYTSEVIIIDSSSTDGTIEVVNKHKYKFTKLVLKNITKSEFNHGGTRNLGAKLASGKYICFLSQDVMPVGINMFARFSSNFQLDPRVVAVFGKQIPYESTPIEQLLDILIWQEKLDKFTNSFGLLKLDKQSPFTNYGPQNYYLWWPMSNVISCYKRSYLLQNPFQQTAYGEDLQIGKHIIEQNMIKIYDNKIRVIHLQKLDLQEYIHRLYLDLLIRDRMYLLKQPNNLDSKIRYILFKNSSMLHKVYYLSRVILSYLIKLIIVFNLRITK